MIVIIYSIIAAVNFANVKLVLLIVFSFKTDKIIKLYCDKFNLVPTFFTLWLASKLIVFKDSSLERQAKTVKCENDHLSWSKEVFFILQLCRILKH